MGKTVQARDIHGDTHEIDTDDLRWRPSAYAVIIRDGRVLLSRQFDGFDLPGALSYKTLLLQ